jgi:diguanylate cyclase (GGDEF)-like protein/PAS domain S-box-containing protein
MSAPFSTDRQEQPVALERTGLPDGELNAPFDELARLAATVCGAPIGRVALVEGDRLRLRSHHGPLIQSLSLQSPFCAHAIRGEGLFLVPNAQADERFADDPLVTSEPGIRFYAGVRIENAAGRVQGTLSVFDFVPRELTDAQRDALRVVGSQVAARLELERSQAELRRTMVERDFAERALQDEESILISFYEAAPMAMGVVELQGDDIRILSANATAARFMGRPHDQLQGALAPDVGFSRERVELWTAMYRESARSGHAVRFEYESQLAHAPRWFSATVSPIEGRPDDPPRFCYIVEDITERRVAEQALRDSRAIYSSLVESLPHMVFRKDLEGRFTFANARFAAELGRPFEAIVGRTDFDFFPADSAAQYRQDDRRVIDTGTILETVEELPPRGARRERAFVHVSRVPIRNETGQIIGVQGTLEDITTQRLAQEALRESEARFRAFMKHTPAIAFIKDERGRYVFLNELFARVFNVTSESMSGKTDFDFLPLESAWIIYESDMAVLSTDQPAQFLETVPTPDGRRHDWLVMKFPFRDANGRRMIGGVAVDITERKELELQLADQLEIANELNAELESKRLELALANTRLAEQLTTDELTGLHNRRYVGETLREFLSFAKRQGLPLSLMMLDVDEFKQYNDAHGHPAGDAVLRAIAGILKRNVRAHDVVARYGGEEFMILQPGTDAEAGRTMAERLRLAIRSHEWPLRTVTASFGIATMVPSSPTFLDDLIKSADRALYHSKRMGRNRVTHVNDMPVSLDFARDDGEPRDDARNQPPAEGPPPYPRITHTVAD